MSEDIHWLQAPKKRGRPPSDSSKSAAQRKAEQRARLRAWAIDPARVAVDMHQLSVTELAELIPFLAAGQYYDRLSWVGVAVKKRADDWADDSEQFPYF